MRKLFPLLLVTAISGIFDTNAQEKDANYGISFSGFVKNDFIFDTRQTVSVREGHFLLYPANEYLDRDGKDINARASFNYLSIQSRLTGKITGPDAFGAKTSGVLEGAFFGATNSDINGFRLRHAFLKLNWSSTELLMGQYWHLLFVTDCFPGTISFNTGVPFQYFSRNPQIRITQKAGSFSFTGVVATQRDFSSPGGSDALRNALLPDLQGKISYKMGSKMVTGIGGGYKKLLPRLQTDSLYKTSVSIGGITAQAFIKYVTNPLTFKFEGTFVQNGYDGLLIGGYAIKSITDPVKNYEEYTSINTMTIWTDIHTNFENIEIGIFAGYTENLGSREVIDDLSNIEEYTRGSNIKNIYRLSPRFVITSGKTSFAAEVEHTGAAFGKSLSNKGVPGQTKMIINNRFLVAAYYFF